MRFSSNKTKTATTTVAPRLAVWCSVMFSFVEKHGLNQNVVMMSFLELLMRLCDDVPVFHRNLCPIFHCFLGKNGEKSDDGDFCGAASQQPLMASQPSCFDP